MSVYEIPGRMNALLQSAYGIANFGTFPVGPGIPGQFSKRIISSVGQSIGGLLDVNSVFRQGLSPNATASIDMAATGIMPEFGMMGLGSNAGLGGMSLGVNPFAGGLGGATAAAPQQNLMTMLAQLLQALGVIPGGW